MKGQGQGTATATRRLQHWCRSSDVSESVLMSQWCEQECVNIVVMWAKWCECVLTLWWCESVNIVLMWAGVYWCCSGVSEVCCCCSDVSESVLTLPWVYWCCSSVSEVCCCCCYVSESVLTLSWHSENVLMIVTQRVTCYTWRDTASCQCSEGRYAGESREAECWCRPPGSVSEQGWTNEVCFLFSPFCSARLFTVAT